MKFYRGPQPGDEKPVGGGSYTVTKLGHEAYNFKPFGKKGALRGFVQPQVMSNRIALERVDAGCAKDIDELHDVTVVFFASGPMGRQVIVGWYSKATVYRDEYRNDWPDRPGMWYNVGALAKHAVLLPAHMRRQVIPKGKGGAGQSNVTYVLDESGHQKKAKWIKSASEYVLSYGGPNLMTDFSEGVVEEVGTEIEKALGAFRGQGFRVTKEVRDAVEDHAMRRAASYFRRRGFAVEDVSSRQPFDLLCRKRGGTLRVEVKGTQCGDELVHLTPNEVAHARSHRGDMALYILHSIGIEGRGKKVAARGGKETVLVPWKIDQGSLKPVSYLYEVPSKGRS